MVRWRRAPSCGNDLHYPQYIAGSLLQTLFLYLEAGIGLSKHPSKGTQHFFVACVMLVQVSQSGDDLSVLTRSDCLFIYICAHPICLRRRSWNTVSLLVFVMPRADADWQTDARKDICVRRRDQCVLRVVQ